MEKRGAVDDLWLMGTAAFLGAFLLFQVQPIMGKALLPWFGGGASVWIACLLFFQVALLFGYLYAHLLAQVAKPKYAVVIHGVVAVCALASLPILPSVDWKPEGVVAPVWGILKLLLAHIGLPYILLASTSPLLHHIFHRAHPDRSPYRLYALSNLGSLLALLAYPFLIEPFVSLKTQGIVWMIGLFLFATLMISVSWFRWRRLPMSGDQKPAQGAEASPGKVDQRPMLSLITWLVLSAIPSALLMTTTTHLCTNIAPIPFIWIALLAAYLLSFILSFDHPRWYSRRVFFPLFFGAVFVMALLGSEQRATMSVWIAIPAILVAFFVICMVMHGELARLKPFGKWITWFFLAISTGGALGGISIALIAPWLFSARYDYSLVLAVASLLPFLVLSLHQPSALERRWVRLSVSTISGITAIFALAVTVQLVEMVGESVVSTRNFYGTLRVVDEGAGEDRTRSLIDGVIDHGAQFINPPRDRWVTTYYGQNAGIAIAMQTIRPRAPLKVGVIGLGAGTLVWYGKRGDRFDIAEINPDVVDIARKQFSFISNSEAETQIILGDGRLAFEGLPSASYDLIAVDAFTSDSVPVHLLTREAFEMYFSKLKANGILCVNVSNRFLDLAPVVAGASRVLKREPWVIKDFGDLGRGLTGSTWIVVVNPDFPADLAAIRQAGKKNESEPRIWTDDHSSLVGLLRH